MNHESQYRTIAARMGITTGALTRAIRSQYCPSGYISPEAWVRMAVSIEIEGIIDEHEPVTLSANQYCIKCSGSGKYWSRPDTHGNRKGGICYHCSGKGKMTKADQKRTATYFELNGGNALDTF